MEDVVAATENKRTNPRIGHVWSTHTGGGGGKLPVRRSNGFRRVQDRNGQSTENNLNVSGTNDSERTIEGDREACWLR